MSKMSELHAELSEQAYSLGFSTLEEALEAGWVADYEAATLRPPVVPPTSSEVEELERAHEEWLKEKRIIVGKLKMLQSDTPYKVYKETLEEAVEFIERGEA